MNRRDTIIIAVLLNAGVLAILFMLAVNEKEEDRNFGHPPSAVVRSDSVKVESKVIAAVKPASEDFMDFNMDEPLTAIDEPGLPMEQYTFINDDSPRTEPSKPSQSPISTTQPKSQEPHVEITVKRGDSLDKLARNNGTTIDALKKANNLKSDMLSIGQILRVPTGKKAPANQNLSDQKQLANDSSGIVYYTMKTGDSPWKIAKQNNMNLDDLLRLNNLNEEKARTLKIGDKIRIQ